MMALLHRLLLISLGQLLASTATDAFASFGVARHAHGRRNNVNVAPLASSTEAETTSSSVIYADDMDFKFDVGQGGVRLAEESAVKISGTVEHKPGSAKPSPSELIRYKKVTELTDYKAAKHGATVVCTGRGKELYEDPGSTTESHIVLAPLDAVRDALTGAGSAMEAKKLVINVLSGQDVQVLEVMDAIRQLVLMLDVATKCKIEYNSIAHSTCPAETSTLTVIAFNNKEEEEEEGDEGEKKNLSGVEKALEAGEVYFCEGEWWTVTDEDINPALE